MKQNEKFLVYAVTGFLVVILAVAILFGNDVPRRLPGGPPGSPDGTEIAKAPPSLEEVLNQRAAESGKSESASEADRTDGADDGAAKTGPGSPGDAAANAGAPERSPAADSPLVANVQLLPPTPAALVTEKLGLNRRENAFRIVRARPGDSLASLVQTWCGSTTEYLEQAKGLNEELTTLRVGQEVVLPWVEDEQLLAALESKKALAADAEPAPAVAPASGGAAVPAVMPRDGALRDSTPAATAGTLRKYKIKAGDSLWKIGEREVGKKQAPRFLEQVKELNPGLDADRIREGQEILLPPKAAPGF